MTQQGPIKRYSEPILAWEYDQRNQFDAAEFGWYLRHAKSVGGPILELACGSGRLTLPLAQAGFTIHGVDNAPAMLDRLHEKLLTLDPDTQRRVTTSCTDMAAYMADKVYNVILIPYNSLQYLATRERILHLLRTISQALTPDGLLLAVVQNRDLSRLLHGEQIVVDWTDKPIVNSDDGTSVATRTVEYYDPDQNSIVKERTYLIRQTGKPVRTIQDTTRSPVVDVAGYLSVLSSAGLTVNATGSYDDGPLSGHSRIACFRCQKLIS
jgi:SAM-dependent methyltransferase